MKLWLYAYQNSCKLFLQILQQTLTEQMFRILNFNVCVVIEHLTGIDERRNYNCEMRSRKIQWPTLIGLHYGEFRATASGIFLLYKKNVLL
jgi:hypothetical protein